MSEIKNVKRFVISVKGIENKQVCVFINKKVLNINMIKVLSSIN